MFVEGIVGLGAEGVLLGLGLGGGVGGACGELGLEGWHQEDDKEEQG
jgi:hypothetical protein